MTRRDGAALVALAFALCAAPAMAGGKPGAPAAGSPPASSASATASASAPSAGATPDIAADIDEAARRLFVEGVAAYENGDAAKARDLLLAAWRVKRHWQIAANLGAAELALGKAADAATHFAFYAREAPADRKAKAKELLAEAAAKAGTVIVVVDVPDAEILVDGVVTGAKPGETIYVDADVRHKIGARKGEDAAEVDVLTSAGRTHNVTLALRSVDGGGPRKELVIVGASVAGAALVVGVATGIAAISASNNAEKKNETIRASGTPCKDPPDSVVCTDVIALRNEQSALTNAALWSLVGAGAVGITTAIYVVTARGKPQAASFVIAPTVSTTGAGLGITGRW